jgi:hypothetical protein
LLKDIEGGPSDFDHLLDTKDYHSKIPLLVQTVDEEIICSDMCNRPAINWGKNKII